MADELKFVEGPVLAALNATLKNPCLETARALETTLQRAGYRTRVFGRYNQRASIEANAESDRGIAERLANAFDASLTAARVSAGHKSERKLTPRNAAQRYFCPDLTKSVWLPQSERFETVRPPHVQFWHEAAGAQQRYRKYNPGDGLATVLVRDSGIGLGRKEMADTILALNSDAKLRTFEAIGQFGHGGSSSLFFCESALIMSKARQEGGDLVYWAFVYPEKDPDPSKQDLVRMWFCDQDGLPLVVRQADLAEAAAFPGTSVWHFGYHRAGWMRTIAGPEQSNPYGRLGRLFFSYPLPFEVHGELARTDDGTVRTITSPCHRLLRRIQSGKLSYFAPEKRETLIVGGTQYGEFSVLAFVLPEPSQVRDYVESAHPVVLTLNGQNHGEMTQTVLVKANLPELSSSVIVEVRLDGIEQEALSHIITNSRENPKATVFTNALRERLIELLKNDEGLQQLERRRAEEKAAKSDSEFNRTISEFLRNILSDASGHASTNSGVTSLGNSEPPVSRLAEIPPADPPTILEFLSGSPVKVPEGSTRLVKFKSDARPPKYAFNGDNPRLFVTFVPDGKLASRVTVVGCAEINDRGYGSISVHCSAQTDAPITAVEPSGRIELKLQSTDGKELFTAVEVHVAPKPEKKQKATTPNVSVNFVFCAPNGDPDDTLSALVGKEVVPFGAYLQRYQTALPQLPAEDYTYWGEKYDTENGSVLTIEVNLANPDLLKALVESRDPAERQVIRQRYCEDIALDCYQHCFKMATVPDQIWELTQEQDSEARKAAEMFLNHDKAIRLALKEREKIGRKPQVTAIGGS